MFYSYPSHSCLVWVHVERSGLLHWLDLKKYCVYKGHLFSDTRSRMLVARARRGGLVQPGAAPGGIGGVVGRRSPAPMCRPSAVARALAPAEMGGGHGRTEGVWRQDGRAEGPADGRARTGTDGRTVRRSGGRFAGWTESGGRPGGRSGGQLDGRTVGRAVREEGLSDGSAGGRVVGRSRTHGRPFGRAGGRSVRAGRRTVGWWRAGGRSVGGGFVDTHFRAARRQRLKLLGGRGANLNQCTCQLVAQGLT